MSQAFLRFLVLHKAKSEDVLIVSSVFGLARRRNPGCLRRFFGFWSCTEQKAGTSQASLPLLIWTGAQRADVSGISSALERKQTNEQEWMSLLLVCLVV